ncbi:MAG TPA: FAD-binding oxidoreductase [Novosphingobium sp.]|nr:FAD-binding oxidoreductase [Novosphingobium sp.]HQQ08958.1 FAD-binding oxidoreductase [Novosphingobium sp.]
MTQPAKPFLEEAAALLGPRGLIRDPDLLAPWLTDWRGRYTGRALALAAPADTQELSALVRLCAQAGVPMVPQGGNSGMSGGATPDASGAALLISLRRLNSIGPVDAAGRKVTCGAGAVLQDLHQAAEDAGLRFPLTLGGKGSATVGGLISTNAGGSQVLRHGSMRAQVLGIEAVLPDGRIYSALTPLKKDNRGFDLKQLFIGSEGTLGIVTAATLRLVPQTQGRVVAWAGCGSIHAARALLLLAEERLGEALEGFEVLPQTCLDAVLAYLPDARAPLEEPQAWHALIEVVGDPARLRGALEDLLGEALAAGTIADATIAASEAQAEALWTLRESISPAERAKGPAAQHDVAVPVESMPAFIEEARVRIEADWPGTRAFGFGHLGDGNIHFHVAAPPGVDAASWDAGDGKAISRMVHDLVTAAQGTISAEHGIGQMKLGELERLADPVALSLMRQVKAVLDPRGLLNPGKLVSLAPRPPTP